MLQGIGLASRHIIADQQINQGAILTHQKKSDRSGLCRQLTWLRPVMPKANDVLHQFDKN